MQINLKKEQKHQRIARALRNNLKKRKIGREKIKKNKKMSVLSDRWIKKMALEKEMIKPFISEQKHENVISYGLSSFGYDARVSNEFKIFTDVDSAIVDPKNFKSNSFVSRKIDECIIPPNSFVLASTVEYFKIPKEDRKSAG